MSLDQLDVVKRAIVDNPNIIENALCAAYAGLMVGLFYKTVFKHSNGTWEDWVPLAGMIAVFGIAGPVAIMKEMMVRNRPSTNVQSAQYVQPAPTPTESQRYKMNAE